MKCVSVDLGMGPDPTAIVALEGKTWEHVGERRTDQGDWVSVDSLFRNPEGKVVAECPLPTFHLRHIERVRAGEPYSQIAQRVKALHTELGHPLVAIDATGVGRATVELFRREGLSPYVVTITAGDESSEEGMNCRVPKKDLVSAAQVMLQEGRLKIARDLPLADLLVKELTSFRMVQSLKRSETDLAWRERANDDIVLALAIGLWIGDKHGRPFMGYGYGKSIFGDDEPSEYSDAWGCL